MAVALDSANAEEIVNWAAQTAPFARAMKVGLQAYLRFGAEIIEDVRRVAPNAEIFLDLKLHDIPATVRGSAQSLAHLRPDFLTVHASGGVEMIKAATEALPETRITAVTVLTSLDTQALIDLGFIHAAGGAGGVGGAGTAAGVGDAGGVGDVVSSWSKLAVGAGARAIVCSPNEVSRVRAAVGPNITLITPGVRPSGDDTNDQARVSTPRAAQEAGADLLVIGRPITGSANPAKAIEQIVATLDE